MKNKFKMGIILLMSVATVFSSCKKDKYQPKGDYQPAGNYGNGTITYSNTVTLSSWSVLFDDGTDFVYQSTVSWPVITDFVKNNGIVMAYFQVGSSWVALPYTESFASYSNTLNLIVNTGQVIIEANGWTTGTPSTTNFTGMVVRLVAVSETGKMMHPDVNYNDYNEVKRVFNLKD